MIRSKGEAGTGDVSNAVTHMRTIRQEIRRLGALQGDELFVAAKELQAPYDLVKEVAEAGKLPVVLFTAGGIATPADAAMMMQLGAEGVFVGSGIFKSGNPAQRPRRSSRRRPSTTTPTWSPRSPAASARPWSASTSRRSRSRTGWPSGLVTTTTTATTIGVLAVQGDVREHMRTLDDLGVHAITVRRTSELEACDGLVIPGGESTTMAKLARTFDLFEPIRQRVKEGMPAFGTCAGMIMLADRIEDGMHDQETLGGLDVTVRRNAFGRQVDSFEGDLDFAGLDEPVHAVFIRAPGSRPSATGSRCSRAWSTVRPRVGSSRSVRVR